MNIHVHSCERRALGTLRSRRRRSIAMAPRLGWGKGPSHRRMENSKGMRLPEARSSPQARLRAGKSSSSDPLLLPLHFSFFSAGVGNYKNESSRFLQIRPKQRRLVYLGRKTTSFWSFFFFFKPIQNDVVLDLSHLSKRRHFG